MAVTTYQDLYGWEVGGAYGIASAGGTDLQMYLSDGTAHTGCYYGLCLLRTTGGYRFTRQFSPSLTITSNTTGSWVGRAALALYIATYPDANGTAIIDFGNGASGTPVDLALRLNTDGTWEWYDNFRTGVAVTGGTALALNTWHQVTLLFQWVRTGGVNDVITATATINAQTLTSSGTFASLLGNTVHFDRIGLGTLTAFSVGTITAGEVHFDDLILALQGDSTTTGAAISLPAATRIRLIPISGQGASAAWTGSFTDLQEIPLDQAGPGQTSTGAGQVTTFAHNTAANFGLGGVVAVKVYGHCKATVAGPTTQQIRMNGVDYPVSITDVYQGGVSTPMAIDWAPSGFDAMEYGMVNSTGASLTLGAIHAEVLYTPTSANWFGCNAPTGLAPTPGCVADLGPGTDSGGGAGCQPGVAIGSDSGGGSGCGVSL